MRARRRPAARTGDEAGAIADVVRTLVAAWNRGDAEGFAGAFAPSATYVTGAGREVRGRAAIVDLLGRAGARVRIVGAIRVRCEGSAGGARFAWSSTGRKGSARRGVIACTLAREGSTWFVRALTNEERRGPRGLREEDG